MILVCLKTRVFDWRTCPLFRTVRVLSRREWRFSQAPNCNASDPVFAWVCELFQAKNSGRKMSWGFSSIFRPPFFAGIISRAGTGGAPSNAGWKKAAPFRDGICVPIRCGRRPRFFKAPCCGRGSRGIRRVFSRRAARGRGRGLRGSERWRIFPSRIHSRRRNAC